MQLRRVLDELWSDGYGVECYLVEWNGRYCVQLSAMYDGDYAEDLGMFDGLTVWPKIERQRLYANESVIEFYDSLAAKAEKATGPSQDALFDADAPAAPLPAPTDKAGRTDDGMVYIKCPAQVADRVRGYIDALMEALMEADPERYATD